MDEKNVSGPWIHHVVDSSCWNIYFFWVVYPFNVYFFSLPFHGIFLDRNGTEWCPGRVEASLRSCRRVVETLLVLFSSQHPVFGREGDQCSVYRYDLWHSVFRSYLQRDPAAVDAQSQFVVAKLQHPRSSEMTLLLSNSSTNRGCYGTV